MLFYEMETENKKYQDFTSLEAWKQSRIFQLEIFELTKQFPPDEKYKLSDQIIRSSRSIAANLSEGHGRFLYQEQIRFCIHSWGSLAVTLNHLYVALDCNYITQDIFNHYQDKYIHLLKLINGYIKFLKNQKENQ